MAQLTLSMLLRAEGAPAAKSAIEGVATATDKLGATTTRGVTADRAAASAKQASAQASRALASSNNVAAGATGNLVANFNDLFMMIGAGQNPLQTAVQQGTQITQVIGPMGAAGAVKALGGAFVAMLSPINLVTLGAIAAGSAFIQWLFSAKSSADSVTLAIDGLVESTRAAKDELFQIQYGLDTQEQVAAYRELGGLVAEQTRLREEAAVSDAGTARALVWQADAMQGQINALRARLAEDKSIRAEIEAAREAEAARTAATKESQAAAEVLKATVEAVASAISRAAAGDMSGPFLRAQGAANALLGIANNILAALGQAAAERAAYSESVGGGRGLGPQGPALDPYGFRAQLARDQRRGKPVAGSSGVGAGVASGGGQVAAAREESNALQDLIASLEGEIEALRVQDPIQRELLKNREALAGATEAEKQKVEELIVTREREQLLMEGAKARATFFEDLGNNALEALIVKGESFNDVLKNIAQSLIQAGWQAVLFGSGRFGSLFGDKSILGQIFPALGGKADGGMVYGPGSGTSDSIPTMLSNGEFVVNARATAQNRQLLEAINAGGLRGYASGGMVGRVSEARRDGRDRGGPSTLVIDVRGAQGNTEVREMVRAGVQQGLALYDREALPTSVRRVSRDGKRVN
jgi:hypothetical protein